MKLREPFTFFVDRSLGRKLAERLRAQGFAVEMHDDHFAIDATDTTWLTDVGRRGWIVLTKDKAIRRNALEREALVSSNVACFMLGRGDLSSDQMVTAFVAAMPRMQRVLRRSEPPLAASVSALGSVAVLMENGALLSSPRQVK